ncbi:dienelactone hydrolase family protein [Parvularcula sp. ZS-1/3]|uniref:Dienelactone hydrolase family protein n=1 Tax=Parvularcula mediterranea TaxID=2732508 RepID=A0A7Y3RN43_9PROT|nr:dienelactone hydrolase family protein [Parvularcula mediterranea]NNU17118.1 dienelactone hydrolase family protein [Parvularcula mediterranea]
MTISRLIEFDADGQTFEGKLVLPDGAPKGTVLICHAWAGRAAHEEAYAETLASHGYAAMAGDVYGKGVRGGSNEENEKLMTPLVQDRDKLQTRLRANLDALAAQPETDAGKIAAAGFCFGGLSVLDMARTNAPLLGVGAFHAILGKPDKPGEGAIKPKVIAFQGFADPMAGPDDLKSFGQEMTEREADWQLYTFGNVTHAFTNEAANQPENGLQFNRFARDRSYHLFGHFLEDAFQ